MSAVLTQSELDAQMDSVLASLPDTKEAELANALCKILGHKSFKASIKPFKTFHGYYAAYQAVKKSPVELRWRWRWRWRLRAKRRQGRGRVGGSESAT